MLLQMQSPVSQCLRVIWIAEMNPIMMIGRQVILLLKNESVYSSAMPAVAESDPFLNDLTPWITGLVFHFS